MENNAMNRIDDLQELKGYTKSVLSTLDFRSLCEIKDLLVDDGNKDIQEIRKYIDGRLARLRYQELRTLNKSIGDDDMENDKKSHAVLSDIEHQLSLLAFDDLLNLEDLIQVEKSTRPENVYS
jgi:hypothetical protein